MGQLNGPSLLDCSCFENFQIWSRWSSGDCCPRQVHHEGVPVRQNNLPLRFLCKSIDLFHGLQYVKNCIIIKSFLLLKQRLHGNGYPPSNGPHLDPRRRLHRTLLHRFFTSFNTSFDLISDHHLFSVKIVSFFCLWVGHSCIFFIIHTKLSRGFI